MAAHIDDGGLDDFREGLGKAVELERMVDMLNDKAQELEEQLQASRDEVKRLLALTSRYRDVILKQESRLRANGLPTPDSDAERTYNAMMSE